MGFRVKKRNLTIIIIYILYCKSHVSFKIYIFNIIIFESSTYRYLTEIYIILENNNNIILNTLSIVLYYSLSYTKCLTILYYYLIFI